MKASATSKYLLFSIILLFCFARPSIAQFQYNDQDVLRIIEDIQEQTPFHFLYRDALVSDIKLDLSTNHEELFSDFRSALKPYNIDLEIDSTRMQVIIFKRQNTAGPSTDFFLQGQIVDADTGERLPYATISWKQGEITKGTSSNQSGEFKFRAGTEKDTVNITCSYVGYASKTISLDLLKNRHFKELTFRLHPERIDGNHIVVTGANYYNNIDQEISDVIDIGSFSPIGESNTLRALQTLPSVSLASAMSDGLHVRGSPTDGFRVLVDDITIYNQSHLFGLVDSFNADILQRSGFFYDVAPAQFQAPVGGTLSLLTKTGSLNKFSGIVGLSNSSARLSLEGPIKKGSSSWLISGRTSYMNTVDWLNNSSLIKWGLNINRDRQVLEEGLVDFQSLLVKPGRTNASFFDLHGKVYFEGNKGNRLILSGYWGGDDTRQEAERIFGSFSTTGRNYEPRPVATTNDWQNAAASAKYQQWITENIYSSSTIGASIYQTSFLKEDFTYIDLNQNNGALQAFVFPLENRSVLNELKAEQRFELNTDPWLWTAGVSYHYFIGEYFEDSFDRPGFFSSRRAHKIDTYAQLDFTGLNLLDIFAGTRIHYYSNGNFVRWSPRLKIRLFPDSILSFGGGFSRNHQFLNQISFSNAVTSDVWIITGQNQAPTSVNYYSAGLYFSPSDYLFVQAEGYMKEFTNVRLHEINAFSLSNTFNPNPWYINNTGRAKGIEFLLHNQWRFFKLTQTLAISEMKLSNSNLNNGTPFYADWDRTYRYTAALKVEPVKDFSFYLSWIFATGSPNKLASFGPQNDERLGDYRRTDISAEYTRHFQKGHVSLSVSIFNVLDRKNPWYRELSFIINQNKTPTRFQAVPVDVYDIGLQPSFNLSIAF